MKILIVKRVSLIVARIDPLWSGIVDGNIGSQKAVTQGRVEESLDSY